MTVATLGVELVSVEEIDSTWTGGFSERSDGTGDYLLLQRAKHDSDQDKKLRLIGYHIEYSDQPRSMYGGLLSFQLHRNRAVLSFNDQALSLMGAREIAISFTLTDSQFQQLRLALKYIFGDSAIFSDRAAQPGNPPDAPQAARR